MARIKKKGLDYFPMGVEFVNDRRVWRLMKREGDAAFTVLTFAYSCLYSENGYYLQLDDRFCEDLADRLFLYEASDVQQIRYLDFGRYSAPVSVCHQTAFTFRYR